MVEFAHGDGGSLDVSFGHRSGDERRRCGGVSVRCELSLAPLITFWAQLSAYHEFGRGPLPAIVREKTREAPELAGSIDDLSVIEKHRAFVDLMMTAMFPPAWQQEYGAALQGRASMCGTNGWCASSGCIRSRSSRTTASLHESSR